MKKLSFSLFALALLGLLTFTACGDNPNAEKAGDKMEEAADAMGDALEAEKNQLKQDIQQAQSDIDKRLEVLRNDMKDASADAKADMQKQIDNLEAKKNQLAQDLEKLGNTAESEWSQFKANIQTTINDIGKDGDKR